MINMDEYVRKQVMLDNLKLNLENLYKDKIKILNDLMKVQKQIEKHEDFLRILEKDDK